MPRANRHPWESRTVEVIKTEEKGSDVNLATYLLLDAFDADYELACRDLQRFRSAAANQGSPLALRVYRRHLEPTPSNAQRRVAAGRQLLSADTSRPC